MNREAFIKRFSTDRDFAERALKVSSIGEAKALAKQDDYEFSDEEINQFLAGVEKLKAAGDSQLNEEALELASGGFDPGTAGGIIDDCCPCPSYID